MIIEKKEIINELQNINHNLEKEVNNLKKFVRIKRDY